MANLERVGIVTTTQYPGWSRDGDPMGNVDKVRGDLALQMLEVSQERGAKLLVVTSELDSSEFRNELVRRGIPTRERTIPTLSGQRRDVVRAIRGEDVDVILLNDPEKIAVVRRGLESCVAPIMGGEADIVIPKRDEALFEDTYPAPQVKYERKQNRIINNALRKAGLLKPEDEDLDWLIGVRFMRNTPEVTDLFLDEYRYQEHIASRSELARLLNPEMWPNGQYIPVIAALAHRLRVKSVTIPYVHPESQTEFENRNEGEFTEKRRIQTKNIVVGCVQAIHYFTGKPHILIEKVE